MALKGRYIYLSLCGLEDKQFTIHLDFSFTESKNVRISLSNIYKEERFTQFSIQVPVILSSKQWNVVCLDTTSYFEKYNCMKMERESHFLKGMMLCANLKVSRIATSDVLYDSYSLPRDINFKLNKADKWENCYSWIEPIECPHPVREKEEFPMKIQKPVKLRPAPKKQEIVINKENIEENSKVEEEQKIVIAPSKPKIAKDPLLVLKDVIGCTINYCPTICWSKDLKNKKMIYAAGSIIAAMDKQGKKNFFRGHAKPIEALCISPKGDIICSADEDVVTVWNYAEAKSIASWKVEGNPKIKCVGISPDSSLLTTVNKDLHNKDVVTIWDLSTIPQINPHQPTPVVVASQISQFNIICIKFGPTPVTQDQLQMCSCGQENIRFWRVKRGMLRCAPVVLDKCARNTVFTSLDYEGKRRVYVGSKEGTVLQINAESQELEFVFKLHDSGIYSLAVNEAFCVTGSDDLFLRVWPLDFSEFFIEAKHEATISALDISPDGVEIACASTHGSIGLLDIAQQKYTTLSRSHTDDIFALDANKDRLISVSKDKTIRVWDIPTMQQAYEFASYDDQAVSVALHPSGNFFACGFQSGSLRIFDIERTAVTEEFRFFDKPLLLVKYIKTRELLIAVSSDGSVSIHNSSNHQAMKQVILDKPAIYPGLTVNQEETKFATIGNSSNNITVWDTSDLNIQNSFSLGNAAILDIAFLPSNEILVLTRDDQIRTYSLEGKLLHKHPRITF